MPVEETKLGVATMSHSANEGEDKSFVIQGQSFNPNYNKFTPEIMKAEEQSRTSSSDSSSGSDEFCILQEGNSPDDAEDNSQTNQRSQSSSCNETTLNEVQANETSDFEVSSQNSKHETSLNIGDSELQELYRQLVGESGTESTATL